MSSRQWLNILKTHAAVNPGILSVVARIICYTIGVISSLLVSDGIFNDGYGTTISVFMLFAVVLEMLWKTPVSNIAYDKAIKSHCVGCEHGGSAERILNCTHVECVFHSLRPYKPSPEFRWRLLFYILCVIGIGGIGFVLTQQSIALRENRQAIERKK